jgi:hypothetical protein
MTPCNDSEANFLSHPVIRGSYLRPKSVSSAVNTALPPVQDSPVNYVEPCVFSEEPQGYRGKKGLTSPARLDYIEQCTS